MPEPEQEGCYPGCFYYSDSCFRADCKKRPRQNTTQPPLQATPMPVFPAMDSLQAVVDYGDSKLPISTRNELFSLLMIYHNTLLYITNKDNKHV